MFRQSDLKESADNRWQMSVIVAILACLLLITNLNVASAQENADSRECGRVEISKFTPSAYSLIPSPFLSADSDQKTSADGSRVEMFRIYNQWTGEHFYTSSISERDKNVKLGWTDEGTGWYAPTSEDFKPVYRLYNSYVDGGDHHYTTSADEKDACVKAGWTYEGEGWRTVEEGEADCVKVLRQYNPYAVTGTHNYTTSADEQETLVKAGWSAEGIGWYGYGTIEPTKQAIDFTEAEVNQADQTYTSKAIEPNATIKGLTKGTDYTVTYSNNINVGTATIKIEGTGNYAGSKEYTFKITPLNISNATVTLGAALTYNGAEQTQTVSSVVASEITLATSDYTVSNNKQTNAGTHTLTVTAASKNFTGSKTQEFTIAKAIPEAPSGLTASAYTNQTLADVELPALPEGYDGALSWNDPSISTGDTAGTLTATAIYTPTDTNYEAVEVDVEVTVTVEVSLFWLNVANADNPEEGILKTQTLIEKDMETLHGSDEDAKAKVAAEYTNYMNGKSTDGSASQEVRLYTKWNSATGESAAAVITGKNAYVEFRIIQVGEHDSDGSAVTFMATHSLPTAKQMNSFATNEGGWTGSDMCKTVFGDGGYVRTGLSGLSSSAKSVTKKSTAGSSGAWEDTTSTEKLWLLSHTELFGTDSSTLVPDNFKAEGTQYQWFSEKGITCTGWGSGANIDKIAGIDKTRAGGTAAEDNMNRWWLRSPLVTRNSNFCFVYQNGSPNDSNASYSSGVVPAFAF